MPGVHIGRDSACTLTVIAVAVTPPVNSPSPLLPVDLLELLEQRWQRTGGVWAGCPLPWGGW